MKKILIVNNNLDMGGIQKSLVNLLREIHNKYDVTLLLFSKSGTLLKDIPSDVKIITPRKCYRILGLTKSELKKYPLLFILKAFLLRYASVFSRRNAMRLMGIFQKKIKGYDISISYSHLAHNKYFANGCGDFVLDKIICKNKICLVHCDYLNSGCKTEQNNDEYLEFDRIACCSNSVRERFLKGATVPPEKVYTLRNFFDLSVAEVAKNFSYCYDNNYINLVTVARLSPEKGVDRAIDALFASKRKDIRYYIIGDGPQRKTLKDKIMDYNMANQVFFFGEQQNPYGYMQNADYLLVPSLNEAAPMVFDEAKTIGLQVISTNTTSALEMISDENGIVCDNSIESIASTLIRLNKRFFKNNNTVDNKIQLSQFDTLICNN